MRKSLLLRVKPLLWAFFILLSGRVFSQSVYLPYSYQSDQKFDAQVYSLNSSLHTSLKPYLIDSTLAPRYNTLMQLGVDSSRKSWLSRILFNQHLIDVKTKEYTFYADYLPDLQTGRDLSNKTNTNLNTRGYQLGGTVGDKFSFYSSGYEDQGTFANYYSLVTNTLRFVPGQSYDRKFGQTAEKDWSYATAIVSYTPIKQLNITLGTDKTFIGDGYRSLLLSDYSAPYPLLRLTANLGPVQYMWMLTYMEDTWAPKFDGFGSNRRKYGVFHYVDWNVNKRLSLGFFNALIAAGADSSGNRHGFDANYINPVILDGSLGPSTPIPDNTFFGGTAKYKIFNKAALYGQVLLDKFLTTANVNTTTYGYQVGIRGADLFHVRDLNYIFEYNTVKPNTYVGTNDLVTSYTQYGEPLGDPLGNNFKEMIGILNYSVGRFDLQVQVNYDKYLVNSYDQEIGMLLSPDFYPAGLTIRTFPVTTQGINASLMYAEGTVSYLINPKYNLHLELGLLYRDESSSLGNFKTTLITFGLRSTFRDLYHDF